MAFDDVYRTPDERFADLPDFDFEPNYVSDVPGYDGLRMHYLDEGPKDAAHVFLCLHGEPTWPYLYRKMLRVFTGAGHRAVAPDFIGFGRSDKPADEVYSFNFHRNSLLRLVEHLDLRNITIVCQNWGGLLGLTLPLDIADRIEGAVTMNTILCTGEMPLPDAFFDWRKWATDHPDMDPSEAVGFLDGTLSEDQRAPYRAPFPNERSKAGPRAFPRLVPTELNSPGADISRRARDWWQSEWSGKSLVACGTQDKILSLPVMEVMAGWIKDCPPVMEVPEGGHFVQEWGEGVAERALEIVAS
jgi:pimeloyl-ACP methyl ester carboxylesterase